MKSTSHLIPRILVPLALPLVLIGCEKSAPQPPLSSPRSAPQAQPAPAPTPAPAAQPAPVPAPIPVPAAPSQITAMGVSFPLPAGWISKPPSNSMRLAEAEVPGPAGDATKACLVVFSTAGGSVDDNIARWAGQVRDPKGQPVAATPQKRTVAGFPVTVVEMTGSYAGMGGGEPQPNYTLRAAIVESPAGLIFIKMTGPAEQMTANAPAFNAMIDGLTKP